MNELTNEAAPVKVTKITVSYGRTINLGNYESLRLEYGMECDVDVGINPAEVLDEARVYLRDRLKKGARDEIDRRRR